MGTLVCTVELDKNAGIKVTLEDPDAGVEQCVKMDATSIVLTMKKGGVTSTITQTEAKVRIECKQFEVVAEETITMSSTKASSWSSKDKLSLEATQDLTATSQANVALSGLEVKASGKTAVKLENNANKVALEAGGVTVSTPTKLALEGTTQIDAKGTMVNVTANGIMKLEASGVATLKGALTNVQGSLVNLGG